MTARVRGGRLFGNLRSLERRMRPISFLALAVGVGALVVPAPSFSQEAVAPEAAALAIVAVKVEPALPAADTLCRLRVEIQNRGEQTATQLGFTVAVNGQKLPVYENHLFMTPLLPGATTELPLYNFWSTETSRPAPANRKLEIEVTLREARWVEISTEGDTETWTPIGDVGALPVSTSITLAMGQKTSG